MIRALLTLLFLLTANIAGAGISIVFRYDDYAANSTGAREIKPLQKSIWQGEQEIDALFRRFNMPYVVAVVPCFESTRLVASWVGQGDFTMEQDPEKVLFLRRGVAEGRIEAAQHGYTHKCNVKSRHRPSEFRELPYQEQYDRILRGKTILTEAMEGQAPQTFVPPFNGWDSNTAVALEKLGFTTLSADRYYFYRSARNLKVIPYTAKLGNLECLLQNNTFPENSIVVVMYHPYDIVKFPGDFGRYYFGPERFEKLLEMISLRKDIEVVTFSQLAGEHQDLSLERYHTSHQLCMLELFWSSTSKLLHFHFLPDSWRGWVYWPKDEYKHLVRRWMVITAGVLAAIIAAGAGLGWFLQSRNISVKWLAAIAFILICLSIAVEALLLQRGLHLKILRMGPGLLGIGMMISVFMHSMRRKPAGAT